MGGNSASTLQPNQMTPLFGQNPGYQQPNQVAPIGQPQAANPLLPTPEQAAAATRARMLARSPMAAPVAAPQKQQTYIQRGSEGSAGGRGGSAGGGGWGGH